MTDKERAVIKVVVDLLNHMEQHGNTPIHEHSQTPRGIDPIEWHLKFGPLTRMAIKNLISLTHPK